MVGRSVHPSLTSSSPTAGPLLWLTLAVFLWCGAPLHAQGCAQCRDNLRSTPPATQHAYRQAIGLLVVVSLAVCSAAAIAMRHRSR